MTTISKTLLATAVALALSACGNDKAPIDTSNDTQASTVAEKAKQTSVQLAPYNQRHIQDEVLYFVLPDRFHNGDADNDNGSKAIAISQGGFDPTKEGHYHGGDVKGLTEKIPYLKEMGITSIWLTPILRNQAVQGDITGYHGYWVLDFTEIDPHLGTNADLKTFIDTAHAQNMKVFFDIITNHTADVIRYKECHGEGELTFSDGEQMCAYKSLAQVAAGDKYTPFVPKGMENVKVPAWLNDPKYYHNQGDSTFEGENSVYGDFFGLDDVNTDDPEVVAGMTEIFKDIITQFKPDGFRIDTVKHVNIEFWQEFSPALIEHAKQEGIENFFMFGEVYDGNPDVLSKYTTEGKVPSVLDFGFAFAVKNVIADQKGTQELANLFAQDGKYKDEDSDVNQLLNFVGNHDVGRLAWALRESEHNYSQEEMLSRVTLAHSMMYFLRGVPVVYYGSEQGFVGDGGNHNSRQDMMPSKVASYNDDVLLGTDKTTADDNFDTSHPIYQSLKLFAEIYQSNEVLRYGQQAVVFAEDKPGLLVATRTLESGEQYLIAYNTSSDMAHGEFALQGNVNEVVYDSGQSLIDSTDGQATLAMSPLSVAIYKITN
ncbi:alpha-amylase family glycosyl hydrolase [Thalassotalea euphylliae]|uniref:alpha-amylase family glycosyl hydrolase n=1 Tax=Thalassotalea euphylliae TaxID=1655234 RepID=UPI0036324541